MSGERKKKKRRSDGHLKEAAAAAGIRDVAARHGAAVNEHLAGYDGVNYEAGFTPRARMQKSLKSIAKSKVDPRYRDANIKQQSGFDAEVIEVQRARAQAAARGEKPDVLRMDDTGPKGSRRANDELIDVTRVDANGNPIPGSGYQMKFLGNTPEECLKRLQGAKCRKYLENDVDIAIPSDYYAEVAAGLDGKIAELERQIDKLSSSGKPVPEAKRQQLEHCRKLKKRLRKSDVSSKEALEARNHPERFSVKEVARQAHEAGLEGMKVAAGVAGIMSGMGNLLAVANGDKSAKEALLDTAKDALVAGAGGYFAAAGGSAISGVMLHSSSSIVRAMGRSGMPGVAITFVTSSAAVLAKYFNGEIRGSECVDELGSLGLSMAIGSATSSAIASAGGASVLAAGSVALLPMAGAIVASMAASAIFTGLKNWAYKDAYAAEKRAREIEARCAEACRMLNAYRQKIDAYFKESNREFCRFMGEALSAIDSSDFETSLSGANRISNACGSDSLVASRGDVDRLMASPFKIGRV